MTPRAVEDVDLAGGRVNASGIWVPAKPSCPERPLQPMPPVEWAASRLLRPYNASLDRAALSEHVERSHWHVKRACAACAASRAECLTRVLRLPATARPPHSTHLGAAPVSQLRRRRGAAANLGGAALHRRAQRRAPWTAASRRHQRHMAAMG